MPRIKPIKQGRAGSANMQKSCRARRKANACFHSLVRHKSQIPQSESQIQNELQIKSTKICRKAISVCTRQAAGIYAEAQRGRAASDTVKRVKRLKQRSEERSVGKECRSRWSPYH